VKRTGWIVISAFVAVPALLIAIVWGCVAQGMLDSLPAAGTLEVSSLFRNGDTVEFDLRPLQPGHDLIGYEVLPPSRLDRGSLDARVRVWQRPILLGKRRGTGLQVTVTLPEDGSAVYVICHDDVHSPIWPPPRPK